jgi:hypothetical protein
MIVAQNQDRQDLETLVAVIAHSQIIVTEPSGRVSRLPAGFDEVDVAILTWIAAEGRRVGRSFVRM